MAANRRSRDSGPLAGLQLEPVYSDELTFALWRSEEPQGRVLKAAPQYADEYETKDWDIRMAKARTVISFPHTGLKPRDLVLGVGISAESRAYPVARILSARIVEDRLGGEPILLVVGPDNKSIRVLQARLPGQQIAPEYYSINNSATTKADVIPTATDRRALFIDSETGSEWSFSGCAISGKRLGSCLPRVYALNDYWFDWRNYHPSTTIFKR